MIHIYTRIRVISDQRDELIQSHSRHLAANQARSNSSGGTCANFYCESNFDSFWCSHGLKKRHKRSSRAAISTYFGAKRMLRSVSGLPPSQSRP